MPAGFATFRPQVLDPIAFGGKGKARVLNHTFAGLEQGMGVFGLGDRYGTDGVELRCRQAKLLLMRSARSGLRTK